MKSLFLLVFLLVSYSVQGQEVTRLSEDACWISLDKSGQLRLADFNSGHSFLIHPGSFNHFFHDVEKGLADKYQEMSGAKINEGGEIYIQCGSYGHYFVFNTDSDVGQICLWAKFNEEDQQLELVSLGSEIQDKTGPCHGVMPGALMIYLVEGFSMEKMIEELSLPEWQNYFKEMKPLGRRLLKVTLADQFHFQELKVKEELEHYFVEQEMIKGVDFDGIVHPVGDYINLKNLY